jgi:hypothetical protein
MLDLELLISNRKRERVAELKALIAHNAASGFDILDVGKIGEEICRAVQPQWQRAPSCQWGYDFIDENGLHVQVKTWGSMKRRFDGANFFFNRLVVIQLLDDGWDVIGDLVIENYTKVKGAPKYNRMYFRESDGKWCFWRRDLFVSECFAPQWA